MQFLRIKIANYFNTVISTQIAYLEKLIVAELVINIPYFMESECSLLCSEETATGPHPKPHESSPHPHILFLYKESRKSLHELRDCQLLKRGSAPQDAHMMILPASVVYVTSFYRNVCSLAQLSWSVPTEGQICCAINARIETMRFARYCSHEVVNFYINEVSRTLDIAVFKAQTTCRIHNCFLCLFFVNGTTLHQLNTLYSIERLDEYDWWNSYDSRGTL
jgi:hypothetical protein